MYTYILAFFYRFGKKLSLICQYNADNVLINKKEFILKIIFKNVKNINIRTHLKENIIKIRNSKNNGY